MRVVIAGIVLGTVVGVIIKIVTTVTPIKERSLHDIAEFEQVVADFWKRHKLEPPRKAIRPTSYGDTPGRESEVKPQSA